MIVAHCFLREVKKGEWYLMCEASATEGMESPFPKPQAMFEVELDEDRDAWADQVKRHVLAMRPDLECVHTLKPRSAARGRPPAFDLAFRPKDSEGPGGPRAKAKGTK